MNKTQIGIVMAVALLVGGRAFAEVMGYCSWVEFGNQIERIRNGGLLSLVATPVVYRLLAGNRKRRPGVLLDSRVS